MMTNQKLFHNSKKIASQLYSLFLSSIMPISTILEKWLKQASNNYTSRFEIPDGSSLVRIPPQTGGYEYNERVQAIEKRKGKDGGRVRFGRTIPAMSRLNQKR